MDGITLKAIMWKWPDAKFTSHVVVTGEDDFDTWECPTHPMIPNINDVQDAVDEYKLTNDYLVPSFNFDLLWGQVWAAGISMGGMVNLPPYFPTIEKMWFFPNRPAIYPYMQVLVAAGKGTADDLVIIVNAFAAQGIDITTIT